MANAYVFNTTYHSLELFIDGSPAGELPGAGASNGYAPPAATYRFDRSGGGGGTGFGAQSDLMLLLDGGRSQRFRVDASQVPPRQDLRLYVFRDQAVLSWDSGEKILVATF